MPLHNIPLYPCSALHVRPPQLPFAILAQENLDVTAPLVKAYLCRQLADCPQLRRVSSKRSRGVFARCSIPANTRLLPVFGLLYSHDELLEEEQDDDEGQVKVSFSNTRRLKEELRNKMPYPLDCDVLNAGALEVIMSVSRACVAYYIRYGEAREQVNVVCEPNKLVERRWTYYGQNIKREGTALGVARTDGMENIYEVTSWVPSALMTIRAREALRRGRK